MACKIPFLYWIGRTRSSGLSALANSCNLLFHPPSLIMADADVDDQAGILLCCERSCHSYVLQLFVEHDTRLYRNLLKKTLEQFLNNLHANIIASKLSFMVKYAFFAAHQKKMGPLAISRLSPPMPNGYWIASLNIGSEKKSYPRRLPLSVRQAGSSHWKTSVFPWVFPYPLPRMRDSPWPNQDDEWH